MAGASHSVPLTAPPTCPPKPDMSHCYPSPIWLTMSCGEAGIYPLSLQSITQVEQLEHAWDKEGMLLQMN